MLEGARTARVIWVIGEDGGLYLRDLLLHFPVYSSASYSWRTKGQNPVLVLSPGVCAGRVQKLSTATKVVFPFLIHWPPPKHKIKICTLSFIDNSTQLTLI